MKKVLITLTGLFFLAVSTAEAKRMDTTVANSLLSNEAFTFVENGITFSVYNDGEFDFFINRLHSNVSANVNVGGLQISFNSGYDYNPFVQYDDYGAIIQIENTPIFYDYYGRVYRIGDVNFNYNHFGNFLSLSVIFLASVDLSREFHLKN